MILLPSEISKRLRSWGVGQWSNVHTKFPQNRWNISKVRSVKPAHTNAESKAISKYVFSPSIKSE
jgi:hypothetical protein